MPQRHLTKLNIINCLLDEYVQHANGIAIYLHTNSQEFSPPLLRTLATTQ